MLKSLSNFLKISRTNSIAIRPVEYVNPTIDAGVVHQVYGGIPQLKFFNPEALKSVAHNKTVDSTYIHETGRGKIEVSNTKDFYIGEGV